MSETTYTPMGFTTTEQALENSMVLKMEQNVATSQDAAPTQETEAESIAVVNAPFAIKSTVENQTFDEERALYNSEFALIKNCTFAGPTDGESVLKECRHVVVDNCHFALRYPLWHNTHFIVRNCELNELTRAPLWYDHMGTVEHCCITSVKAVRECLDIQLRHCHLDSEEFGWKSSKITLEDCFLNAVYCFFDSRNITLRRVQMSGKYSFQYINELFIEDSNLDTKDAFWHCRNVTVKNSIVKGEYLGWYSDGLTLINCKIIGTQPLCYCKNLKLINCTMEGCDLAFEYSDVDATIIGHVDSIKNPKSGRIVVDSVGEIIREHSVFDCHGEVVIRESEEAKSPASSKAAEPTQA